MIDLATLTGAIDVALGSGAAAVFTNSSPLWDQLHMVQIPNIIVKRYSALYPDSVPIFSMLHATL